MGTDVHTFLEYSHDGKQWELFTERQKVKNILDGIDYEPDEFGHWCLGRDYEFFGIIAGVRGFTQRFRVDGLTRARWAIDGAGHITIGKPKGLPVDLSRAVRGLPEVKHLSDPTSGWHHPSWGTLQELRGWVRVYKHYYHQQASPGALWRLLIHTMERLEKKGTKTRIVFFFDS
jgi:hypothetical protein